MRINKMRDITIKLINNEGREIEGLTIKGEIESSKIPRGRIQDFANTAAVLVSQAERVRTKYPDEYRHYQVVLEIGEK